MTGPVPIALMVRALDAGGTERQFCEFLNVIDRERFSPHVVCFREGLYAEALRRTGIPILVLPMRSFRSVHAMGYAWDLARYLKRHRIQLAHTYDFPLNCFGVPVARLAGTKVVLSSQRSHRNLRTSFYRRALRVTDRLVHGVVVNCESVRQDLLHGGTLSSAQIHLCYNGLDVERYRPAKRVLPPVLEGAGMVIGSVSLLRQEKGHDVLVEAFAQVAREIPSSRLLMVGSGPKEQVIRRLAASLGVAEKCCFQPTTPDVTPWLRAIDIFVQPSRSEAFSNSLMEAMACGRAVVASRVGGNPELVTDGETGRLFESGSAGDLAGVLRNLAANANLRQRLGDAAARKIRQRFSIQASAHVMEDIYTMSLEQAGCPVRPRSDIGKESLIEMLDVLNRGGDGEIPVDTDRAGRGKAQS